MKIKLSAFLLLAVFTAAKFDPAAAQNVQSKWLVGLGMNFIEDNGHKTFFTKLMFVPYPATAHGARYLGHGLSVDAAVCFNKYANGMMVHSELSTVAITSNNNLFYSFDLSLKYDLHEFYYQLHKRPEARKDEADANRKKQFFDYFDPYVLFGYGYTYRAYYEKLPGAPTNNFGLGFNVWIKSFIGLNFQGMAKFRMTNGASNYIQYSAGVVYRFPRGQGQAGEGSKKVNMKF